MAFSFSARSGEWQYRRTSPSARDAARCRCTVRPLRVRHAVVRPQSGPIPVPRRRPRPGGAVPGHALHRRLGQRGVRRGRRDGASRPRFGREHRRPRQPGRALARVRLWLGTPEPVRGARPCDCPADGLAVTLSCSSTARSRVRLRVPGREQEHVRRPAAHGRGDAEDQPAPTESVTRPRRLPYNLRASSRNAAARSPTSRRRRASASSPMARRRDSA